MTGRAFQTLVAVISRLRGAIQRTRPRSVAWPLGISLAVVLSSPAPQVPFAFEVTLKVSTPGIVQLFYDPTGGDGVRETDSARLEIRDANTTITHRFALPAGTYKGFRFDPIDREGTVRLSGARILRLGDWAGEAVVRAVPVTQFQVANSQIQSFTIQGDEAELVTIDDASDPILLVPLVKVLTLKQERSSELVEDGGAVAGLTAVLWLLLRGAATLRQRTQGTIQTIWSRLLQWGVSNPGRAVATMAVLATLLSTYPVVFFARSFVSPNHGTVLLYDRYPTLPGYSVAELEDNQRADVGAPMWAHLPYSVVESDAVFRDGEWPLWNRFNSTGVTLLGQGQSMFGDPLHIGVLLARGASWAWDAKYVAAKALFVFGLGLTVLACTRHLGVALVLTLSSAFIGFFAFRLSHPAFFSLAYAPWILYSWIRFVQAPAESVSSQVRWLGALVLANLTVMNSGTAKEAYMLLIFLNLTGGTIFLLQRPIGMSWLVKALRLTYAQVLFVLIGSPVWWTFLEAIQKSYSSYATPTAVQISPALLLGLFDDLFYRQIVTADGVYAPAPSVNFLILTGVLWAGVCFRRLAKEASYLGVALGAALAMAMVFGVVPPDLIARIPFLGNVVHIHNTFSVVAIVHLVPLAGFGLKACWDSFGKRRWMADFGVVLAMLAGLLVLYVDATKSSEKTAFFGSYSPSLFFAAVALPLAARRLSRGFTVPAVLILTACLVAIHWRHGMYLKTKFDPYVMNPQVRVDLHPPSPAIDFVRADADAPYRSVGFEGNLFAGYNAAIGVESIYGPDALINRYYRAFLKQVPIRWGWDWKLVVQKENLATLRPIYDLLNVKSYLALPGAPAPDLPGLRLARRFDLDVYQSDTVWPRAFFTNQVKVYESAAEFAAMALAHDGHPFAAVQSQVLAEQASLRTLLAPRARLFTPASRYELTNNTTSFTVNAPEAGVIVLTEAYSQDDFVVTLDGKPARVFRVNHAFKGVEVDHPGTYRLAFSYWPQHFSQTLAASALGLILMMLWVLASGPAGSRYRLIASRFKGRR